MIEVIGAGFGRTGTASLKVALEQLGFGPCYHMFEVMERPERAADWLRAAEGGAVDWERIFAGYRATVDWPAAAYWRELVERYPEARVILTVRDPDRWFDSASSTIFRALMPPASPLARLVGQVAMPRDPAFRDFVMGNRLLIWEGIFGGRGADREHARAVFQQHAADVQAAVPAGRLLVYEVTEGWEPLCAFLGVPVPDTPFPRLNDAATFRRRRRERMVRGLARPAGVLVGGLVAAAAVAVALWRRPH